jgi:flagellar hook assembly protein FlgD
MITDIESNSNELPRSFILHQNFPNPFNPSTTISFTILNNAYVTLKVYDILGREVATLVNKKMTLGKQSIQWNTTNESSGVYFYRLQTGNYTQIKKMILLR